MTTSLYQSIGPMDFLLTSPEPEVQGPGAPCLTRWGQDRVIILDLKVCEGGL
jgi:hypothetical protein